MKTRVEGKDYFWSLSKNSFINVEKNIFDCQVNILVQRNRTASVYFMTANSEILFAEFRKLKLSPQFFQQVEKYANEKRTILFKTRTINPEKLISYFSKMNCGKDEIGKAFDEFICSWL